MKNIKLVLGWLVNKQISHGNCPMCDCVEAKSFAGDCAITSKSMTKSLMALYKPVILSVLYKASVIVAM